MNNVFLSLEQINGLLEQTFSHIPNCFGYDFQDRNRIHLVNINDSKFVMIVNGIILTDVRGIHLFFRHRLIEFHVIKIVDGKTFSSVQYFPLNGLWQFDIRPIGTDQTKPISAPNDIQTIPLVSFNLCLEREFDSDCLRRDMNNPKFVSSVNPSENLMSVTINGEGFTDPTGLFLLYPQDLLEIYFGALSVQSFSLSDLWHFGLYKRVRPARTDHHGNNDDDDE